MFQQNAGIMDVAAFRVFLPQDGTVLLAV